LSSVPPCTTIVLIGLLRGVSIKSDSVASSAEWWITQW
jgi:hypothetical protein